jgi:hypothetical protein
MSRQKIAVILLLFLGISLQGAWPVPDVNESHYVAKMIRYWNKDWVENDPFLESANAHPFFYTVFGWPSRALDADVFTWVGRLVGWFLLSCGWYALAAPLVKSSSKILLSGILFTCLQERFNIAGEWIVGGLEAKVPAYGLVFLGISALLRAKWNLAWVLLGLATAFHVLAGGWAWLAASIAWVGSQRNWAEVKGMLPGLIIGGSVALIGLIPAATLNLFVDRATVVQAHEIYLYRLGHHLSLLRLPTGAIERFLLLAFVWFLLEWQSVAHHSHRLFRIYVGASLLFAAVGAILSLLEWVSLPLAAALLRYYWFRLADVMVPAGVAIAAVRWGHENPVLQQRMANFYRAILLTVVFLHLCSYVYIRLRPQMPRADENRVENYAAWRDACRWVAESGQIPKGSRFLTPRVSQTFRWYARRAEVVNWKDIPQDARSIVNWWHALCEVHAYRDPSGQLRWLPNLAQAGTGRIVSLARRYGAQYILVPSWPPLELPIVYQNTTYTIYLIPESPQKNS